MLLQSLAALWAWTPQTRCRLLRSAQSFFLAMLLYFFYFFFVKVIRKKKKKGYLFCCTNYMCLLWHIQRLTWFLQYLPLSGLRPPRGENSSVWMADQVISEKWQRAFDWTACWSDGFWMLSAEGICEPQREPWQHEKCPMLFSAPKPHHLAPHSPGAEAKDGGLRGTQYHFPALQI